MSAPSETSYDLSEISHVLWVRWLRSRRVMVLIVLGVCALAAVGFVYLTIRDTLAGHWMHQGQADVAFIGFFAAFGGVFWWAGRFVAKTATAVVITKNGVEIQYPTSRPLILNWADPSFRMRISTIFDSNLQSRLQVSQFWSRPRLYMWENVGAAVVDAARAAGMEIRTVKDPNSVTGTGFLIRHPRGAAPAVS